MSSQQHPFVLTDHDDSWWICVIRWLKHIDKLIRFVFFVFCIFENKTEIDVNVMLQCHVDWSLFWMYVFKRSERRFHFHRNKQNQLRCHHTFLVVFVILFSHSARWKRSRLLLRSRYYACFSWNADIIDVIMDGIEGCIFTQSGSAWAHMIKTYACTNSPWRLVWLTFSISMLQLALQLMCTWRNRTKSLNCLW